MTPTMESLALSTSKCDRVSHSVVPGRLSTLRPPAYDVVQSPTSNVSETAIHDPRVTDLASKIIRPLPMLALMKDQAHSSLAWCSEFHLALFEG